MRIIPPSFIVLDDLDKKSLAVRIEYCGRVCYKSEDKISQDSAIPFASKMAEHGHNSVLEMGVITLDLSQTTSQQRYEFFLLQPKFLHISVKNQQELLLTGSVRSLREIIAKHAKDSAIVTSCARFLHHKYPYFFPAQDNLREEQIEIAQLSLPEVDQLPTKLKQKHRHIAVKFIVNRAVTHEIVRHRPCSFLQESQRYCRYANDKFGGEVTFINPMFFPKNSPEYQLWQKSMEESEKIYLKLLETSTPQAARTVLPNSCKTELIVYANLDEWQHIFNLRTTKAAEPSMREVMIPLQEDFCQRFPDIFSA